MKYKTIILDRDGVINEVRADYVRTKSDLVYIPGSIEAINKLLSKHEVVVASNQAGVGKGLFSLADLQSINDDINSQLLRDIKFFYCTHQIKEKCNCRKPLPGLLLDIKLHYPGPFLFVGDNETDYQAAQNASIDFCYVRTGYGPSHTRRADQACLTFDKLEFVANWLLES